MRQLGAALLLLLLLSGRYLAVGIVRNVRAAVELSPYAVAAVRPHDAEPSSSTHAADDIADLSEPGAWLADGDGFVQGL